MSCWRTSKSGQRAPRSITATALHDGPAPPHQAPFFHLLPYAVALVRRESIQLCEYLFDNLVAREAPCFFQHVEGRGNLEKVVVALAAADEPLEPLEPPLYIAVQEDRALVARDPMVRLAERVADGGQLRAVRPTQVPRVVVAQVSICRTTGADTRIFGCAGGAQSHPYQSQGQETGVAPTQDRRPAGSRRGAGAAAFKPLRAGAPPLCMRPGWAPARARTVRCGRSRGARRMPAAARPREGAGGEGR